MQLSDNLQKVFAQVFKEAKDNNHEFITPEHLLLYTIREQEIRDILLDCEVIPERLDHLLSRFIAVNIPHRNGGEPGHSVGFQSVLARAVQHTEHSQRDRVELYDILVSIFDEPQSHSAHFLKSAGLTRYKLLRRISHGPESEQIEPDDIMSTSDDMESEAEEAGHTNEAESTSPRRRGRNQLENFITDLTQKAREGSLEPLIGREDILERTMQVLCRRSKNNPIHVGDPGVGKTAITEGMAMKIVEGKVPTLLKNSSIIALNVGNLVAGTRFRGDFEDRMTHMIKKLEQQNNTILFIDEIHSIVGAGASAGNSVDAASMLKPLLTSGKVRCIGATTYSDFRRYIERDHALIRRFQKIEVPELSAKESIAVLKGIKSRYEEYHRVHYSPQVLTAAVQLAAQYINERKLPDKAIDVIDECGAAIQMYRDMHAPAQDTSQNTPDKNAQDTSNAPAITDVTTHDIEKVVARMAQIPQRNVNIDERAQLKNLYQSLSKVVFGQDHALKEVSEAIKRARAGFRTPNKPVASLLFVGPTGVGKTELARQLAHHLGIELLRFDMSEYQERHTVSRLIGSPPGYVGFDDGAQLTDAVRRTPHAVLLLDEIEKAHSDIQHVLLQIMDYATITDNSGKKADFRNIILIMTSNAGAREIGKENIGFSGTTTTHQVLGQAVERFFTPEFRGRLDKVVSFNALPLKVIESVVRREIKLFNQQLSERKIKLSLTPRCIRWLARKSMGFQAGARDVSRLVEEHIRAWFVDRVLFGSLSEGAGVKVTADIVEDGVEFKY